MIELRSKDKIRDDWWDTFIEGGKSTDLDRGAERIFYWILADLLDWKPNSAPIGSNLFFETPEAFIHIEVKTSRIDNPSDYRGLVPISIKQTNYVVNKRTGKPPSLPEYYNEGRNDEKACLTYALQVIHDPETLEIIAILLICIPNGQLYHIYGDKIVGAGKVKGASFRYRYRESPYFETLTEKPFRFRVLYVDKSAGYTIEDITHVTPTN